MNFWRRWLIRLVELAGASQVQSSTHVSASSILYTPARRIRHESTSQSLPLYSYIPVLFAGSAHAISYNIFGDVAPPIPAWRDSNAVELGVKFIANGSMQVQGVRFYKGSGNNRNPYRSPLEFSWHLISNSEFQQ